MRSDFQVRVSLVQPALPRFLFCRQLDLRFSLFSGLERATLSWTEVPNLPGLCSLPPCPTALILGRVTVLQTLPSALARRERFKDRFLLLEPLNSFLLRLQRNCGSVGLHWAASRILVVHTCPSHTQPHSTCRRPPTSGETGALRFQPAATAQKPGPAQPAGTWCARVIHYWGWRRSGSRKQTGKPGERWHRGWGISQGDLRGELGVLAGGVYQRGKVAKSEQQPQG